MNFCNFAKVIIGRNSKDPATIQWWSTKDRSKEDAITNWKTSNVSPSFRFNFYMKIMQNYPKMHLPYDKFVRQLPRLQKYITKPKYWQNSNREGQKKNFLSLFSLQQWNDISHRDKLKHSLYDCVPCETSLISKSALHNSLSENAENVMKITNEVVSGMCHKNSSGAEQILNVLDPLMKENFKTDLKSAVAKKFSLTEKLTTEEKRKEKAKINKKNKSHNARIDREQ
jgi:hypothetical protein